MFWECTFKEITTGFLRPFKMVCEWPTRLFIISGSFLLSFTSIILMKGKTRPSTNFALYLTFYDQSYWVQYSLLELVVNEVFHGTPFTKSSILLATDISTYFYPPWICMLKIFKEFFDGKTLRYKCPFPEKSQNLNSGGHL